MCERERHPSNFFTYKEYLEEDGDKQHYIRKRESGTETTITIERLRLLNQHFIFILLTIIIECEKLDSEDTCPLRLCVVYIVVC